MVCGDEGGGVCEGWGLDDLDLQVPVYGLADVGGYGNGQSAGFEVAQEGVGLFSSGKGVGLEEVQCIVPVAGERSAGVSGRRGIWTTYISGVR